VKWEIVFAKAAVKDAKKLAAVGLKAKAQELLDLLASDPFQNPPPFEKLVGDLEGAYSRRINIRIASSTRCSKGTHGSRLADVVSLRMNLSGIREGHSVKSGPHPQRLHRHRHPRLRFTSPRMTPAAAPRPHSRGPRRG